jgi:hypothetical protein
VNRAIGAAKTERVGFEFARAPLGVRRDVATGKPVIVVLFWASDVLTH